MRTSSSRASRHVRKRERRRKRNKQLKPKRWKQSRTARTPRGVQLSKQQTGTRHRVQKGALDELCILREGLQETRSSSAHTLGLQSTCRTTKQVALRLGTSSRELLRRDGRPTATRRGGDVMIDQLLPGGDLAPYVFLIMWFGSWIVLLSYIVRRYV